MKELKIDAKSDKELLRVILAIELFLRLSEKQQNKVIAYLKSLL